MAGLLLDTGAKVIGDVDCRSCGQPHPGVELRDPPPYANLTGKYFAYTCRTFGAEAVARCADVRNRRIPTETEAGWILPTP